VHPSKKKRWFVETSVDKEGRQHAKVHGKCLASRKEKKGIQKGKLV